jgi:hypothetical protein
MVNDHVHMLIKIPPKCKVAEVIGYIKGKSAIAVARQFGGHMQIANRTKLTFLILLTRLIINPTSPIKSTALTFDLFFLGFKYLLIALHSWQQALQSSFSGQEMPTN